MPIELDLATDLFHYGPIRYRDFADPRDPVTHRDELAEAVYCENLYGPKPR